MLGCKSSAPAAIWRRFGSSRSSAWRTSSEKESPRASILRRISSSCLGVSLMDRLTANLRPFTGNRYARVIRSCWLDREGGASSRRGNRRRARPFTVAEQGFARRVSAGAPFRGCVAAANPDAARPSSPRHDAYLRRGRGPRLRRNRPVDAPVDSSLAFQGPGGCLSPFHASMCLHPGDQRRRLPCPEHH
jgi:hypothetical protein